MERICQYLFLRRARGYESPTELLIVQQSKKKLMYVVAIVMRSVPLKVRLAISCDFCHSWVHALCEWLEDKEYEQLTP